MTRHREHKPTPAAQAKIDAVLERLIQRHITVHARVTNSLGVQTS